MLSSRHFVFCIHITASASTWGATPRWFNSCIAVSISTWFTFNVHRYIYIVCTDGCSSANQEWNEWKNCTNIFGQSIIIAYIFVHKLFYTHIFWLFFYFSYFICLSAVISFSVWSASSAKIFYFFFFCTSRDVEGQTSTHKQHREYEKMKQQQKNMREICITKQELCNLADALLLLISYRRVCMDEYFLSKFFLFYFFISTAAAAFLFFFCAV